MILERAAGRTGRTGGKLGKDERGKTEKGRREIEFRQRFMWGPYYCWRKAARKKAGEVSCGTRSFQDFFKGRTNIELKGCQGKFRKSNSGKETAGPRIWRINEPCQFSDSADGGIQAGGLLIKKNLATFPFLTD